MGDIVTCFKHVFKYREHKKLKSGGCTFFVNLIQCKWPLQFNWSSERSNISIWPPILRRIFLSVFLPQLWLIHPSSLLFSSFQVCGECFLLVVNIYCSRLIVNKSSTRLLQCLHYFKRSKLKRSKTSETNNRLLKIILHVF